MNGVSDERKKERKKGRRNAKTTFEKGAKKFEDSQPSHRAVVLSDPGGESAIDAIAASKKRFSIIFLLSRVVLNAFESRIRLQIRIFLVGDPSPH
jgi:hypothetical protein